MDSSGTFTARFKGGRKGKKPPMTEEEHLAQCKAKGYCTHCRNHGHKTEECRRLKAQCEKGNATACIATDSTVMHTQAQDDSGDVIHLFRVAKKLSRRNNLTDRWLIDSGASRTMSSQCDWFQSYQPSTTPRKVWLGDNSYILAHGISRIPISMQANNKWNKIILQDALYVPELHSNLLSVSTLTK